MVCASTVRDDVGFGLPPVVSHSGLAGRLACLFAVAACLFAVAVLFCVSSAHAQVIEEGGFPVKGGGISGEPFSLSCPSRFYVAAGESVLLSCTAEGAPEEGVRYGWESVSGEGLDFLSASDELSPLFAAPLSGAGKEYAYRLTAMAAGVYRTASLTVTVEGVPGETVGAPVVREECDSFTVPDELGEGCVEDKGPAPFGFGPEAEGGFLFPESPVLPDRPSGPVRGGGSAMQAPPRLECPAAVFLEELETGQVECHAWDDSGEEHLAYSWEPVGSTTRNYLDNPRLIPEDSPHPSVIAPEAPSYETLESFRSGDRAFRYRYRLTATSRATGLSSHAEVEVFVSSSRPVVYCPLEVSVEEGETARLDCEGADPLSFRMEYDEEAASVLWEWEGLWGTSTAPLDATDLSSPLFTAPAGSAGGEYHYIASMTLSASGVRRTARRRVTVTIVSTEETEEALAVASKASAPSVECEDAAIYEATDKFELDCEAQEVPDGATYSWTARGDTPDTDLLIAGTDGLAPTFDVPGDIDEPDEANKDYEYMVTMTVGGVAQDSADITVTVLEKPNISCSDTSIAFLRGIVQYGARPGETRTMTPCFGEFRGAPEGSNYVFTWISADVSGLVQSCTSFNTRCVTGGAALAALDRTDRPTATWTAPSGSPWPGEDLLYVYSFRVSAPNADPLTLGPSGLSPGGDLPRSKLSITCEDYAYQSYAGGSPDFWDMDCQASGAWFGYTVTWKWDPPTFFTGHDTGTPRYDIPSQVRRDTTFTYTVSVSATDHDPGEATIAIRVFSTNPTIACSDHTVYEAAPDFNLNCRLTFHPPFHPDFATFNWTGTDVAGRLRNTDSVTPRFVVPPNVDADTDYKYTLTMSGPDIFDVTENVAVTVQDRSDITVTCADPGSVYEGAADVAFSCSASGAPQGSAYAWSWSPATFLTGHDTGTPTFAVPDVERDMMYTYTVTASATGARSPPVDVKVTVLNKSVLSVACTHADTEVYEGAENFALDCEASGAPGDDPQYTYAWTGDAAALDLLDVADDETSATFLVPPAVDEDKTYRYTLTVSAQNADDATAEVEVTVLNKKTLRIACTNADTEVYEGAENFALDCEASGAPGDDPQYTYAWTGDATALALLDANDIASPTFSAPDEVTSDETYEYVLTVSAENSDDAIAEVMVTVLNKKALALACADPPSVYEGAEDFTFGCTPSGAPSGSSYTYAWTGDAAALALLDADDIASPTFAAPDTASSDKTYEYTLTVSAENADAATAEVTVTVLNKKMLFVFCAVPASVFEGSEDITFNCDASGAPSGSSYTYAWTGDAAAMALLDPHDIASPTFAVPDTIPADTTYEYTLTVSAENADTRSIGVTLKVLKAGELALACTIPLSVYEGAGDVLFDCVGSGAPGANPVYTYAWTGDAAALALLDVTDIASPTFAAPNPVDEDKTYRYTLTISAQNTNDASLDVAITVLNKKALSVGCTGLGPVYEGSADITLDCEASGAPSGSSYTYAWTGDAAAMALLDPDDIASPTFSVPDSVPANTTYEYLLTASAENAEDTTLDVAITVLNKGELSVACTNAGTEVYEGSENVPLGCEASGAPGANPVYTYAWTGDAAALALLDANDIASPTFSVPVEVTSDETYEYTLTVSAQNAGDVRLDVAITVLNKTALAVVCTNAFAEVYEGAEDFELDCEASGAPGNDPEYTYAWTGRGSTLGTSLLSAPDIRAPLFHVPNAVSNNETYEYTLTVSAENAGDTTAEVAVTVLNKETLLVFCAVPASVFEGSGEVFFDCSASGAPGINSDYTYAWTGDAEALALLDANDIASPTFFVPDAVDEDRTYEYTLTASTENADTGSLDITVKVLNAGTLSIACSIPLSVFEGSGDVLFDCSASGAPGANPIYTYAWTADAATLALLNANDIASPTFSSPDDVPSDERYAYTLTVSAQNVEDARLDVAITVVNKRALAVGCTDPGTVYEGSDDILFDCEASGAPDGHAGLGAYTHVWTPRGSTPDVSLLSAADIASPLFYVPEDVDATTTYEYLLTASANNAEDNAVEVSVTVLNEKALVLVCAPPPSVYEGSDDVDLDCSASGGSEGSAYEYVWTARGSTPDVSLLSAPDIASPTFYVPAEVDEDKTYEYRLTVFAENAKNARATVTVTVLNKSTLALACADPPSVYEGSEDIAFDCEASGAPAGSTYEYSWTPRGSTPDVSLLSALDIASPIFYVPAEVDENETYEYLLTASAQNADNASAEVAVTVLNKAALALTCADPPSVYEGSEDIVFDCEASGALGNDPQYTYAWTARGNTQDVSLLSAADIESPTFYVPDEVIVTTTYEYLLTVSAQNADDGSAEAAVRVLDKPLLAVVCAGPGSLYEGSEDITFDCEASGAPAGSAAPAVYTYVWTPRGSTPDVSLLSATDIASPAFYVPDEVDGEKTYEYLLTVSAENADDGTAEVSVTVLNEKALAVACADPPSVYEGSEDIDLDCSASGGAAGAAYEYVWTARGSTPDVSLLSAANIASPTFYVPDEVDENETYEYLLTVSAQNTKDATAEVTVTVLNKSALAITCADPPSVYEGSEDIVFDCEASGAPEGSTYEYSWTPRGDTQDTALLSAVGIASPTFYVPDEVDEDKTYEYLLTVSAQNADNASAEVAVTVLNKSTLALTCADPPSVYEGSEDIAFDCSASGAPGDNPQYTYVWTARGSTTDTSLLSAVDIASPVFFVPDEVDGGETYEYTLAVSAQNAEDGSAEVTVTVLDKPVLAVACAGPYSLYEGSEDFAFDCSASGAPGDDPQYTYVWTARGDTQDTSLLSGTDGPAPTFLVPDDLPDTATYEYLLTASAENAEDDNAEVSVTVMHPAPLAFVDDTIADRVYVFTVGETIEDIVLPGAKGGFPPYAYTFSPALPPGLAFDDQARTISGTPSEVRPRRGYAWQVSDADAGSVSLAFFIEVTPVPSPTAESLSPEPEALSLSAITTSVSPLRFGVQASNTQVVLDPTTDRITTHIAGPYHTGRMTLSADGGEGPLATGEEIALSVELASPVLLRREGETVEPAALALSPSWSYTESCEGISSQSLGGLYTELLLSEGDCPLLLFGGELDLVDALPGRYEGVMDVIIRQGETEETRTLEVDVTVVPAQRVITIGPGGVRFSTSRELPAGLTEFQNLSIYPDVAFLTREKPHGAFELSNPSLIPLEVSVSARFGYTEATEEGREIMVENAADSDLGDLSSVVDIHPSVLVLQPGEKGLVRYGIREEVLSSLSEKGYAAFFDVVSAPRQYVDLDRMPEEVIGDRTARVTMRIPGVYVSGDGASRLRAELLSITEGISLSATFLVEALDGPFMGEVIAYDGEGRELGRRETLVYTRSRVRVPLSRKPDEETVFLRFAPRGPGRIPEPTSIRWNAPNRDIGEADDKDGTRAPVTLVQKP